MWRLWVSALLCLPALILLFVGLGDHSVRNPRDVGASPAITMSSNTEAPTPDLTLPPPPPQVQTATAESDALTAVLAAPVVSPATKPSAIHPVGRSLAMRRHAPRDVSHHFAALPNLPAGQQNPIEAFIQRHLTRYSFAPPNQNGGG